MKILTGIDLPVDLVCGSTILINDLYSALSYQDAESVCLMLQPAELRKSLMPSADLLSVKKRPYTDAGYINELTLEVLRKSAVYRPDVIHAQHLGFGMAQALAAISDVPYIAIAHGTDIDEAAKSSQALEIAGGIVTRADSVIFPTHALYAEAERIGLSISRNQLHIVPWGTPDPITPVQAQLRSAGTKFRCLSAGRLDPNKDISTIIRALSLLPDMFELTIIGTGPDRRNLEALVAELDLGGRVYFTAPLAREALWQRSATYDCAIFASVAGEAFGMWGVEMQKCGAPLIRSDLPVFNEVLGDSAICFPRRDYVGLASAISELADSPALLRSTVNKGLEASYRYSVSAMATAFAQVTSSCLKRATG